MQQGKINETLFHSCLSFYIKLIKTGEKQKNSGYDSGGTKEIFRHIFLPLKPHDIALFLSLNHYILCFAGAEKLYGIVKDFAGNVQEKTVFDLYCGTGTIGQIMSSSEKGVSDEVMRCTRISPVACPLRTTRWRREPSWRILW